MNGVVQLFLEDKERIAGNKLFQAMYSLFTFLRYAYFLRWKRDFYAAHAATLRYERIATSIDGWQMSERIHRVNSNLIMSVKSDTGGNPLLESYLASAEARQYREEFRSYGWQHEVRLKYPRTNDEPARQGDLLVLKPYMGNGEKGVILVQYNDAFNKFVSIYDLRKVEKHYRIVLEPSTWGYGDPALLFFLTMRTDVVVQAQYAPDYDYVRSLDANLVPVRMGAGDWIDDERFQAIPFDAKVYDIVMVASWQRIKRHELLFRAVGQCRDAIKKLALIGYPSSGRTKKDVLLEASKYGVADKIDIYENIPRPDVSRIIGQSKIGVMLTLREGANRGIYECFFSGVPVVISDRNVGVNREHINESTGLTSSDSELAENIVFLLNNIQRYAPRDWALKATGYKNATRRLNACLKACATRDGEPWTQDIYAKKNDTNARFACDKDRIASDKAAMHLRGLLRM